MINNDKKNPNRTTMKALHVSFLAIARLISHADLWALAANVAIKVMGGPEVTTHFGRFDVQAHKEGMQSAAGRLPDGDKVLGCGCWGGG